MIALDLSTTDDSILQYASHMCEIIKPKKVYFINIQPNLDLDDETKALMGADKPMDEHVMEKMKEEVSAHFSKDDSFEVEYEVVEGNPSNELLRWVKMKDADLLVMGRKLNSTGTGVTPGQLCATVQSSVLMVPDGQSTFKLDHIMMPIDFSDHSISAIEEAYDIQKENDEAVQLSCVHIYELPLGHEKSGKTSQEFANIIARNSAKKFAEFKADKLGAYASGLECAFVQKNDDQSVAETIYQRAHSLDANLIIIGAKGRTLISKLFLGSVAQRLIKHDSDIPLLIVKRKKDTFDFWEYFSSI